MDSFGLVLIGWAPIALVIVVIVGFAVAFLVERGREVRRHARILAELGAPMRAAAAFGRKKHEIVTLEGRLSGGPSLAVAPSAVTSFHPYGTSFLDEVNVYAITHSSAATPFAIDLDDGDGRVGMRVVLEGPSQVLRGSIETEHTASLDKASLLNTGAEPLARATVKKRVGQFRIVKPGDRVRVRGAIEPAPDNDALYRDRSNVLRMTPAPTESPGEPKVISIVAMASRRRRVESRRGLALVLLVAGLLGGGLAALSLRADPPARLRPAKTIGETSGAGNKRSEPACRAAVLAHLTTYDDVTAMREAQRCDDPYTRAMVHYAAGDFAVASAELKKAADGDPALVPSLAEVETHLFVHDFGEAAKVVRRMNTQFYPGPSTAEKRHLECILDVLEQRAKRQPAPAGDKVPPRFVKVCATRPFVKLARQLDSNGTYHGEDDWPRPTFLKETRYDAVSLPYTAVVATRSRLAGRPVALERDLLDRLVLNKQSRSEVEEEDEELSPILATWAAELTLFYAYAGFPERSARYWPILDRVATVVESGRSFRRSLEPQKQLDEDRVLLNHVMSIAGAAALYSGDRARTQRYANNGEPYSSQATRQMERVIRPSAAWEDPVVDRTWPEHKAVFDAAASGNAEAVVKALTDHHANGRTTLARVLPLLGERAPLRRWYGSTAYPQSCPSCGASTFLGDLSDRREVARLLDDRLESDRLRQAAERFTTALTDPELGFELDELEVFFATKK